MMGGNLRRRSITGSLIVVGAVVVLSACGGGHEEDDPITHSYVGNYQVSMGLTVNNCRYAVAGALSQVHRVSQEARNILVERENIAYQGNVEVDNKGFVAYSLAQGRPVPEGRLFYRNTGNPNLFTVTQSEFFFIPRPTEDNPDAGTTCEVTYYGTATRI